MTKGKQGRFLLLYGSQTGQAKAIAEEIFETAPDYGLDPEMHCFSMTDKKFSIEKEECAVIVVSTTGEGDPPDTASKFWRRIKKKTLANDHLSQLHFTLLGLGDSNYTSFCLNGKNFDHRFQELGACHFYPAGFADDATGLEIVAEPWLEGLYPALRKHLGLTDIMADRRAKSTTQTGRAASEAGSSAGEESESGAAADSDLDGAVARLSRAELSQEAAPSSVVGETNAAPVTDPSPPPSSKGRSEESLGPQTAVAGGNPPGASSPASSSNSSQQTAPLEGSEEDPKAALSSASTTEESIDGPGKPEERTEGSREPSVSQLSSSQEASPDDAECLSVIAATPMTAVNDGNTASDGQRQRTDVEKAAQEKAGAPKVKEAARHESEVIATLKRSVPPLAESGLTLPVLPPEYLQVEFHPDQTVNPEDLPIQGGAPMPSAATSITMATVVSATRLTRDDAVKTALDVELDISESGLDYQPGDSFSIICPNDKESVGWLLGRLGLEDRADCPMGVALVPGTKKRRAALPEHIPGPLCTPRHALMRCCEIHAPLKKALLRVLVEHTTAAAERRRLQELCSKQGAADYGAFVREPGLSLLDILAAFPSCVPPLPRLLEHLPRLQPRPYSIASSPLADPKRLHFVFNVVVFPEGEGRRRERKGVCTGWLSFLGPGLQGRDDGSLADQMTRLEIHAAPKIPVFGRANRHFRLPADPATPIIMVGPGTGVAPFVGFLQHRHWLQEAGACLGPAWLFFGCRHEDRDYLYRETLEGHLKTGVLSQLSVSFSRDRLPPPDGAPAAESGAPCPRYVQDNMRLHAADLCRWILEENAVVYVCGDARNMAKNVNAALSDIFGQEKGKSPYEAACLLATLREEKRYLEDVWT